MRASSLKGMNNKARLIDRQILKGKKAMMIKGMNPKEVNFDEREKKQERAQRDRPAFPTNARMFSEAQGLTKREYFAVLAMQALIPMLSDKYFVSTMTREAVLLADDLLKQLET